MLIWFAIVAVALRLATLVVSLRNERRLKADGATEFGSTVCAILAIAHVLFYVSAVTEGMLRAHSPDAISYAGLAIYTFGMAMLLVVMHLLGRWWTVKLIIGRDHQLVTHPLFRVVRHPNYFLNILPELIGFALVFHAYFTLVVGLPCYLVILALRIRQEDEIMKTRFAGY